MSKKSDTKVCHKMKTKFQEYKNCLAATQLENEKDYLEKTKLDMVFLEKIIKNS